MRSRRWAGPAIALAFVAGAASPSSAHEGETHAPAEVASSPRAFASGEPGTYALPALGEAADGDVLTSEGRPARLHALFGGDAVLLSFIYTQCSDAEGCPLATAVLHRVASRLAAEPAIAPRIRVLSLSFDPSRDTPAVMLRYGESFVQTGLDWRFLTTGSEAELAPILAAYRQTRVREVDDQGEETGRFAHLLRVFLIDAQARIRQVYSTSLLDPDALVADIETILLEADAGSAPRIATTKPGSRVAAGPGDDRDGYEQRAFSTRSRAVSARRGSELQLAARVASPPLGLPAVPVPDDNPITPEKIALGRRLFFDRRLSPNGTVSCAMCHVPEQGFAHNEMATAVGIEGRTVRRNAPTIFNTAYLDQLFHDGRETSLELQIWGPLLASNEMGNASIGAVLERLAGLEGYASAFESAFPGRGIAIETIGMAVASYERTLLSGGSAFDHYRYGGDDSALSASAKRGFDLFVGAAGCAACHPVEREAALFTDGLLHNTGMGFARSMGRSAGSPTVRVQAAPGVVLEVPREVVAQVSEVPASDLGRYEVTGDPADRWRYRTPSLRNVALTAPYMHDGSLSTLRDVVVFYRDGGVPNENLDPRIRPLDLDDADVEDLVAFLESLTGDDVEALVADAFAAPIGDIGASATR